MSLKRTYWAGSLWGAQLGSGHRLEACATLPLAQFRSPGSGVLKFQESEKFCWRGSRDCYGAALEPDDSEEVVISYVWNQAGEAIDFGEFEDDLVAQGMRIARRG